MSEEKSEEKRMDDALRDLIGVGCDLDNLIDATWCAEGEARRRLAMRVVHKTQRLLIGLRDAGLIHTMNSSRDAFTLPCYSLRRTARVTGGDGE